MDKWIKAANTIRIKIALRLSKRDPQRMILIINDVINKPLMTSPDDDFSIRGRRFTEHGNFNPSGFYGSAPLINFMVNKNDSLKMILDYLYSFTEMIILQTIYKLSLTLNYFLLRI